MKNKLALGGLILLAVFVIYGITSSKPIKTADTVFGNIATFEAMQATTTDVTWTVTADFANTRFKQLCSAQGILGSVIIQNETAGSFNIYDGTTTNHVNTATSTILAKVYASQAEGAYPYNAYARTGIIIEFPSTNVASSTITYRCL